MSPAPAIQPASDPAALAAWVRDFALREIVPRGDLRAHAVIPSDLWKAIGDAGLARIGLPEAYGGDGGDLRSLAVAAEAMAAACGVRGVVNPWLGRQLNARQQILLHGSEEQRQRYLPGLAAGTLTPCLAISEPKAGAHPKYLSATAERDGDDFVLNGEKAYLSNGPIADFFMVLAITGTENGRKRFSALIVPRDTPGLELTEGVKIDFMRPAPHCGLRLTDVRVPTANLLGQEGDAFETISLPMRRTEDALFAASIAGAMRHQLAALGQAIGTVALEDDQVAELGRLAAVPDGLFAIAYRAAELLDLDADTNADAVSAMAAAARDWAGQSQERVRSLIDALGIDLPPMLADETRDLEKGLGIARSAHDIRARQRARALLPDTEEENA